MKTPEQLAEEYIRYENESAYWTKHAFLAGFQAAKDQVADASKVMPQWISVKDRLPQDHGSYLVTRCCVICGVPTLDIQVLRFLGFWDTDLPNAVTHWMPLPALPKEEEK